MGDGQVPHELHQQHGHPRRVSLRSLILRSSMVYVCLAA